MKVTICVDALSANPGGIGRYTWELCKGLAGRRDIEAQYFGRNRLIRDPGSLLRGEEPQPRKKGLRKLGGWWDRQKLNSALFHGPNYFLPQAIETGVVTIHDLSVFRYPETHPVERVKAFEREFARSLDRAAHIITDTETVRQELIADFDISGEMVTAVHLGVDAKFGPSSERQIHRQLTNVGLAYKAYALCVSTLEPRKKIGELLAAWRRLPVDLRNHYPLALVGGSGWRNEHLQVAIQQGEAEGWLRHLGFVDESDLPALYAGAALFVYPSIYEGFGLPPLEAMASGTPVVVSRHSCLPEVSGDAARYIDPDDPEQFLACIHESLVDEAWQADASRRGLERAKAFTWGQCIEQTVAVYRKVAGSV